ncbi:MAG: protoheme IX farnesyltransferase, partial [Proteobacteria bacterium]|nr:protoheme IX farnesyltransferase [Pseudomonadota bacterium]
MVNFRSKTKNLSQEDLFNFSELFKLMKPRVMSLVIFTCAVGLLTAPNVIPNKDAIIGILLGAAGALNMWYESDLDALMTRTCLRPIPAGKVNKNQALILGVTLSIVSVITLDYFANRISAALLLFTILFYVFVYTIWLKRKTPQNIVIGGIAGALPPVIGWTIATNSISIEPLTFFLIIFFWTPSHFWALSLYKSDDYKKAKIPMLPLTNGIESTKINIFVYSLLMLPVIIFPYVINFVGLIFLIPSLILTLYYNYLCYELYKFKKNKFDAKKAKSIFVMDLTGKVLINNKDATDASPHQVHEMGVAHVPEDRERDGLVASYSIADNLVLNRFDEAEFSRRGVRQSGPIKKLAGSLVDKFDVRTPSIETRAGSLSGGNKQKLVIARELAWEPELLIAAQPTRGVDVGSIEFIHNQIVQARDNGAAVLLVSAELDEVLGLADRVAVIYAGKIVAV